MTARAMTVKRIVAPIGGAILGLGAIQAYSRVALPLHRAWCEANIPHDHKHAFDHVQH